MTPKALLAAAVVIALALSPSVSECIQSHQQDHPGKWLLWGWVLFVVVLAFAAGEVVLGGA